MNMFYFEFKKIVSRKIVLASIALFIVLDIAKIGLIYNQVVVGDSLYKGRQIVINQIKGTITNENLSFVIKNKRELDKLISDGSFCTEYSEDTYSGYQFGDRLIFNELYHSLDYAYHYTDNMESVRTKASGNISLFPSNSYETKKSEKISDTYRDRKISEFYDTVGFENYLNYDFSALLILLLLLLIMSPVFSEEAEIKMDLLISSSPKGKASSANVKLAVCSLIAVVIPVLFCFLDYIVFDILFHFEGGTNPLYSIESFMYTPFNITINRYILLSAMLNIIGSVFFCLLFLLFSSLSSRVLSVFLLGGGAVLLSIIGNDFFNKSIFNNINPLSIFINRTSINHFNQVNLFGYPVNALFFLVTLVLMFSLFLTAITLRGKRRFHR
ncbi:MAG TPA: hypothetical protein VFC76_06650 [Oscillospiraceae bacterium]|nr:hypothetical protein [Oscillospiraceae bacterium]